MGRLKGSRSARSKFWSMRGTFRGTVFESGYEKKFLDMCFRMGVKVERSKKQVPYQDDKGKWHQYNPDFYLPEYDYTVEVKGTWAFRDNHGNVREKFIAATSYFKGRYTLITERELKSDYVSKMIADLHARRGVAGGD